MSIKKESFGKLPDGQEADLFTLTNRGGMKVSLTNYGATLVAVETPDRSGKLANVSLCFDNLEGYLNPDNPYIGCLVGRFANRIADAKFTLDGKQYALAANAQGSSLHGGKKGFDKMVWKAQPFDVAGAAGVTFTYTSPDGEEGYPGTLAAKATYSLTDQNELKMEYSAATDKPTVVNLTNHAYWNLAGAGSGKVYDHELMIDADSFLVLNENYVATGEIKPVKNTPLDFTQSTAIGARIAQVESGGYDRCYVLKKNPGEKFALAARVVEPKSGRVMEVHTDQPGVQLYTATFMDVAYSADGKRYGKHDAFCLETQQFPDAPNQPTFPSTVLRPGETYTHLTVHKFSAR